MNALERKTGLAVALAAGIMACGFASAATMTVTTTNDAATLSGELAGNGVTISNATYTGPDNASGTFTGGTAAGLGIDSGIVLTSGSAAAAGQPFISDNGVPDTNNGAPGDPAIANSNDAVNLTFHFTSTSTTASFTYFFASAEYSGYVNSQYNDEFVFLFNGQNIALIPGTNTPVAINNVNAGGPNSDSGIDPSNTKYFIDNLHGANPGFDYAGYTKNFVASISGLTPGADNTISLIIADVSDWSLDSAVFIGAGSFTNQPPPSGVPEPSALGVFGFGALLTGLFATLRRRIHQS
ncbi:MAG TPA: choice-of-anchor L domain-containing protein [Rhodanobacteraceae bacterium]|nr:choice-of-anchor L domain-containing protein [Rhodanobacteraceae bacterium]